MIANGFTGFNPTQAKQDISNFFSGIQNGTDAIAKCIEELYNGLEKTWCSPNAELFSKDTFPKLFTLLARFISRAYISYDKLVTSYNIIASKHGVETITSEDTKGLSWKSGAEIESLMYEEWGGNPYLHAADPKTGAVGMNISETLIIKSEFMTNVENAINILKEIPSEISFYDPDNAQQIAFKTGTSIFSVLLTDSLFKVAKDIEMYINLETNNVNLSVQESEDELSMGAPVQV